MKVIGCLCFALCVVEVFSDDASASAPAFVSSVFGGSTGNSVAGDSATNSVAGNPTTPPVPAASGDSTAAAPPPPSPNDGSPKVYLDLSKSAKKNAVSFDGIRGLFGLIYVTTNFGASLYGFENFKEHTHKTIGLHLGLEYSKSFRKNFVLSGIISADLTSKFTREASWSELNKEYERAVRERYEEMQYAGLQKTGILRKGMFCPSAAVKCGYPIKAYESMIFLKLGASLVSATYFYDIGSFPICAVSVKTILPSLGLGIEKKFNKQWGASLETNISLRRPVTEFQDYVSHKIKTKRFDLRLVGLYTLSQDNKLLGNFSSHGSSHHHK
ncbi:MAG: hypothetical protein LBO73_02665 [Holosporaceae bacterium]|jgi:hypothetical protein|nr:hypothetical protein [Holosporaceae bacterium]